MVQMAFTYDTCWNTLSALRATPIWYRDGKEQEEKTIGKWCGEGTETLRRHKTVETEKGSRKDEENADREENDKKRRHK